MRKVFVLGLDGATLDLINPWVKQGKLPHLARLMKEGSCGRLRSTIPDHSAPAWSSFITGKNPGKHGIYYFSEHLQESYKVRFVNASLRDGHSLWKIVGDSKKKVGILNVPMTYPPEKVNGFMVSGMDSPGRNSGFTYPPWLYDEIEAHLGEYIIEAGLWSYLAKGRVDLAIQKQRKAIRKRFEAMRFLMHTRPWDFFMVVFTETDRAQHVFWKYMDPKHPLYDPDLSREYGGHILSVYEEMDEIVKYLFDSLDEETLFVVMSDHGAGPCGAKSFYLNNWLRSKGLLFYKDAGRRSSGSMVSRLKNTAYTSWLGDLPRKLWRALPREKKELAKKFIPQLRDFAASQFYFSRIDMERTLAYAEESKTFIWINKRKSKGPGGACMSSEEYEKLRELIVSELHKLTCPETGESVIERAYRKEEIYHGPHMERAPDIVVTFKSRGYVPRPSHSVDAGVTMQTLSRDVLLEEELNLRENGRHNQNGILMLRGSMVRSGAKIEGACIMDLAPTILHTLGLPVLNDMDGEVLSEAFHGEYLERNPIEYCTTDEQISRELPVEGYSEEQEKLVQQRLRDLGYL